MACANCSLLRAERDEYAERLRQLEDILIDSDWMPEEWSLTATEAMMLNVLTMRKLASKEQIHLAIYGADPNGGPDIKILDVMLLKLRRKLGPYGIGIETVWGNGLRLDATSREKLAAMRKAVA